MPAASRTILGLVGTAVLAVVACSGSSPTAPPVPSITLPSFAIPSIAIPSIAIPSFAVPSGAIPSFAIPSFSLPSGIPGLGPVIDASTIVTADAAASIIGGPVTQAPVPAIPTMSIVGYTNAAGGSVTVLVEAVPAGMGSALLQTAISAAGGQGDLQLFGGLGDAAGKTVNDHEATVVFAKGTAIVVLQAELQSATGADLEAKIEAIAHQIADKL